MQKSDIFWELARYVADLCQVDLDDVMHDSRKQDVVDARLLIVQYARRIGYSSAELADIVIAYNGDDCSPANRKKKSRIVSNIFRSYMDRADQNRLFCLMSIDVKKWVKQNYGVGMAES